MATFTIAAEVVLELVNCPNCGVIFGLPQEMQHELRQTGNSFYCPNGHALSYRDSEVSRLKKKLRERDKYIDDLRGDLMLTERRRRAAKGQLTKWRNKLAQGACVCCGQVVLDLAQHMAEAHPDFVEKDEE
jgi:predicted RNA-binding Zn-ribbon protein involved in translation (DUF1610 family)